eukprot:13592896-Alexandrium_andersonii.AAC.1
MGRACTVLVQQLGGSWGVPGLHCAASQVRTAAARAALDARASCNPCRCARCDAVRRPVEGIVADAAQ